MGCEVGEKSQAAWRPGAEGEGPLRSRRSPPKRVTEVGLLDCPGNTLSRGPEVDRRRRAESLRRAGGQKRVRLLY